MKNKYSQFNITFAGLAIGLSGLAILPAQAAGPKTDAPVAQAIASQARTGSTDVIVHTAGSLTDGQKSLLRSLGAGIVRDLPFIQSVALHVPTSHLQSLAALPFVLHVSFDGQVKKYDAFTVGSSGGGAAYANYGLTGQGVTVAVIDSGVLAASKDLSNASGVSRVLANISFVPTDVHTDDFCGHGSHIAGIIAGNGAMSTGAYYTQTFYGIARNANLVNVRVLDGHGQSSVSTVLAGLQWVVSNKGKYNIKVVNLSLGHPVGESYTTDPLCQAVESAWKAGIVVVCAAGNSGRASTTQTAGMPNEGWGTAYGSIASPGNDPYVITVGATKRSLLSTGTTDTNRADDKIATYSSRGPSRLDLVLKPDLVAPGNRVISVDATKSYLDLTYSATNAVPFSEYCTSTATKATKDYFRLSGTSMAAPVVAGAAALMLQKDPSLTPDTIKARLMVSADKWTDPNGQYDPLTYGAGYLDIPAALQNTVAISQPALSPTLGRAADGSVGIANSSNITWGNNIIWGKNITWGNNITWGTNIIWGNNITWGNSSTFANGTLASSNIIWGNSVWSDNSVQPMSSSSVDLSSTAVSGE